MAREITGSKSLEQLVWLRSFEIGVTAIDDEHKQLFALAGEIPKQFANGSAIAVATFIAAAANHFIHEEEILSDLVYPRLKEHKKYHSDLLQRAKLLKILCDSEHDPVRTKKCYEEVVAFLIDDILRGDVDLKSFLQYRADVTAKSD